MKELHDRKEAEQARKENTAQVLNPDPVSGQYVPQNITFTDYDSVFDLIEDTSGERHIRAISQYAWVCVAQDRFILSSSSGSYLKIEKSSIEGAHECFVITETVSLSQTTSKAPFMKPRQIAQATTFTDAVHAADTFAQKRYPFQVISKNQSWRNEHATEWQLAFLNKLRLKDDKLTAENLTKGKAGDMITKLKHGARGRFRGLEANKRRLGRIKLKVEQEQTLREREKVSVGPLLD
jgi:ATP-dependent helicase IRC3